VAGRLAVRLTPRGGRDAIEGWTVDEAGRPLLKARVAAPPVDGQANAALLKLLAKALGAARSSVQIVAGDTSRVKTVAVDGLTEAQIAERLGGP
jgi:uncharacterized protein (TIGR00251 family)